VKRFLPTFGLLLTLLLALTVFAPPLKAVPRASALPSSLNSVHIPYTPRHAGVPYYPCQTGSWVEWQGFGNNSYRMWTYLRRLTDNSGHYCGYYQPVSIAQATSTWPFGDEPMNYNVVQLWQADGTYLDGYTWSGLLWLKADQTFQWMWGPGVWVTCGSPVKAWSSWQETISSNQETDYGFGAPSDGEDDGEWTVAHTESC
jgi:hypothetical protein